MLERLYNVLDVGSGALSSAGMRLACCQLIVMNAGRLLLQGAAG